MKRLRHGHYVGDTETSVHAIWRGVLARCNNPNAKDYPRYGGRGIKVCERWLAFENFLADMGERPPGKSLDRWPDNNGNYEPENVRWATRSEQERNKRTSRIITHDGVTDTMVGWAERLGVSRQVVHHRMKTWGVPCRDA